MGRPLRCTDAQQAREEQDQSAGDRPPSEAPHELSVPDRIPRPQRDAGDPVVERWIGSSVRAGAFNR